MATNTLSHEDRLVAAEMLSFLGATGFGIVQGLYKTAHHQRDGLTDKEYTFLMARHKAIEIELHKLSKLSHRLRHHG